MKRVGLYFGSFNPIHMGHLILAEYFASSGEVDEVWLIVSPRNPLKEESGLAPEHHRLEMVKIALKDNSVVQASDIEFGMPRPSYTIDTLNLLEASFPRYQFTLIMGEDNLPSFHLWKSYTDILDRFPVRVFPRMGVAPLTEQGILWERYDFSRVDAPLIGLSSTQIRQLTSQGKSTRYLLPDKVRQYIHKHRLFIGS